MNTGAGSKGAWTGPVVARITPARAGAIGAVQVAGAGAGAMLRRFFTREMPADSAIVLGDFLDHEGSPIDRVLVARLLLGNDTAGPRAADFAPRQPTDRGGRAADERTELYEITCHGGLRIVQRIIDTLERAGARLVCADDLLSRTYGLDDPVAAEAYRLLPQAKTALAARFLLHQAQGALADAIRRDAASTLKYWPAVRYLLTGVTIVILGPPNAGKSTLLNALARGPHALVADRPGTTRDYVQAPLDLAGLPAELIDTAGLGPTDDPLAGEAARKTHEQIARADLVFLLLDATDLASAQRFASQFSNLPRVIVLLNKIDRPDRSVVSADLALPASWPVLEISALHGLCLDRIPARVWTLLGLDGFDYRRPTVFTPALAELAGTATFTAG